MVVQKQDPDGASGDDSTHGQELLEALSQAVEMSTNPAVSVEDLVAHLAAARQLAYQIEDIELLGELWPQVRDAEAEIRQQVLCHHRTESRSVDQELRQLNRNFPDVTDDPTLYPSLSGGAASDTAADDPHLELLLYLPGDDPSDSQSASLLKRRVVSDPTLMATLQDSAEALLEGPVVPLVCADPTTVPGFGISAFQTVEEEAATVAADAFEMTLQELATELGWENDPELNASMNRAALLGSIVDEVYAVWDPNAGQSPPALLVTVDLSVQDGQLEETCLAYEEHPYASYGTRVRVFAVYRVTYLGEGNIELSPTSAGLVIDNQGGHVSYTAESPEGLRSQIE